jgi:hypothetical protein
MYSPLKMAFVLSDVIAMPFKVPMVSFPSLQSMVCKSVLIEAMFLYLVSAWAKLTNEQVIKTAKRTLAVFISFSNLVFDTAKLQELEILNFKPPRQP